MSYLALEFDFLCQWDLPSGSKNPRKAWDSFCIAPNECRTTRWKPPRPNGCNTTRWKPARGAAKGEWALKLTSPSESGLGFGGKKAEVEELWREFFLDPTGWWDHRSDKPNPRCPDFKHTTHPRKALWLDSKWNPAWVQAKLAAKGWEPKFSTDGGRKAEVLELWLEFFSDPMEWRDHRLDKADPRFPDFKHTKHPEKALWLDSKWIPPWVEEKMFALPPDSMQLSSFSGNQQLCSYIKCGSIEQAEMVFNQMPTRNVVTFNTMISGYVKCGDGRKALELFEKMQRQGVDANLVTYIGVLNACGCVAAIEGGKLAHEEIILRGYDSDIVVGNCLVDMYAKCGSIEEAEMVFNQMSTRSVVTFSIMIDGYVKCGEGRKALELFEQMQGQGVDPNAYTFAGVLNACGSITAIEGGRRVHEEIIRRGYESDLVVGTCLVDMYAKCGNIEEAEMVFNQMPTKDAVTWSAMIAGYGIHGYVRRALETFTEMCKVVEVDSVTFISLLSACSHGGLVTEGLQYFKSMTAVYNITPTLEHFACVVDLLGRAGQFADAEDLISSMPMNPDARVWMTLLGACSAHANVEVGERCAKRVLELDPYNDSAYVLLSNIYVVAGKFDSIARLNGERWDRGVKKIRSCTWIEVNAQVHSFVLDDHLHPCTNEIRAELDRLSSKMIDRRYVPETRLLQCKSQAENDFHLCHHSEKLAVAFGLISTVPGTPLLIRKNLPVCRDCHTTTKFISKIVGRTVTVKNANQFHHFQHGLCTCGD